MSEARRLAMAVLAAALVFGGMARAESGTAPEAIAAVPAAAPPGAEGAASASPAAESGTGAPSDAVPAAAAPALAGQLVLDRVWGRSGDPLPERARQARVASLQLGIWSLDPAARALLHDASLGSALERAEAAALLAPELPDAELAVARERLVAGDLGGSLTAASAAFTALARHPEASLWLRATLADAGAHAAIFGGLLYLAVAGLGAAAALATPIALRLGAPTASAAALLGALLLLPAAAGQGAVGVALACAAVALARGDLAARGAVLAAALVMLAGLHGIAERRDLALAALANDPVGIAALSAERDFATPLDLARLARAPGDPLARRAFALHLRRAGGRRRGPTAASASSSPRARARPRCSTTPPTRASPRATPTRPSRSTSAPRARIPRPLMLFNLAQAYGRAILLEEQDLALAQAQALDPRAVHALTQHVAEVGGGGPVDVAVSAATLRARGANSAPGGAVASAPLRSGPAGRLLARRASPDSRRGAPRGRRGRAARAASRGGRRPLLGHRPAPPGPRGDGPGAPHAAPRRPPRPRGAPRAPAPGGGLAGARRRRPPGRQGCCSASSRRSSRRPPGPRCGRAAGWCPTRSPRARTAALLFGALALLAALACAGSQALSLALLRRRR